MKQFARYFALAGLLAAFSLPAFAQPAIYVAGTHYTVLDKPVRTADPSKIEVTEVFWYGCSHCYAFEPLITNFEAGLPDDVAFVRSPGMWNQLMEIHAQIYYTAESLGVVDKIHSVAFNEIHQKGNYLQSADDVRKLFQSAAGVSASDFDSAWNSFGVTSAVKRAGTRMRDYGVRGVPNLVVNGKYRVESGPAVATQADMLKVVDFLVDLERKAG